MPFYNNDSALVEQSETFRSIAGTNVITHVTFKDKCSVEKLKLLLTLCCRVQYLSVNTLARTMEPITRFLLDKTNPNTRHLCSLCFTRACRNWPERLRLLIDSDTLLTDYILKLVDSNLYLWW